MNNDLIDRAKKELENCESFKHWEGAIGLAFEEFSIYDLDTNTCIKKGNQRIGNYNIMFKVGELLSINYCMNNEFVRQNRLKQVSKKD